MLKTTSVVKVAIMQPYFFSYAGYFQLIAAVDKFVVYDDVSFIKQGWINRNRILVNGQAHTFTIPVRDISSFRLIRDTELHERHYPVVRSKFLKTLQMEYRRAPYFQSGFELVERVLMSESGGIAALAVRSITEVCQYLGLTTQIIPTSSMYGNGELKGKDRVIDICKKEKAEMYVNVPGGMELYSKEDFRKEGLELKFIKAVPSSYAQFNSEFIPGLSMIDILMFNSRESCGQLVGHYELL